VANFYYLSSSASYEKYYYLNIRLNRFQQFCESVKSRDSSVGIALGYGLDDRGSGPRFSVGILTAASRTALRPTQPHIHCVTGALSLEVK
jgi:hypothetical protein